jgi:hypothetical protein
MYIYHLNRANRLAAGLGNKENIVALSISGISYICIYVYIYIYLCTHIDIYIYVYIYIYI